MKLTYGIADKPKFGKTVVFAIQQLLAIMTATLVVPVIVNGTISEQFGAAATMMSPAAALFGAGVGTLIYLLFTRFKSPVFLGSSFAFLGSMAAAFTGAVSVSLGYFGLVLGAILAGLVYVIISIIVKFVGTEWINKLMPASIIGPTVAIIGLSLAGNAISDFASGSVVEDGAMVCSPIAAVICGFVTLLVTTICSTIGSKNVKLIPFIIGIIAGYATAAVLTLIGTLTGNKALLISDYSAFEALTAGGVSIKTFIDFPEFTFLNTFGAFGKISGSYIGTIIAAYVPVAFVVFAEHIADHKNISSIIEKDLLEDPGLSNTLLGDGVGSMAGAFFGGCPNTTYGESIACVAITGNASVITIFTTAVLAILISFLSPFVAFVNTIPHCVMGGVCIALYGFIAVSGLKMVQKVDLENNRNLFTVSTILICGIGGLTLTFGAVTITNVACALIFGIIVNKVLEVLEKKNQKA